MNFTQRKLILGAIALGALWMTSFNSMAMPDTEEHCPQKQISSATIHEHIKARLSRLADRLEIKSSQQAAWETFAKSVEVLTEHNTNKPNEDADAATIVRFRADRVSEFANKLNVVADATAKLQKILTDDQRKILNQASHHFLHNRHEWRAKRHWQERENDE